MLVIFPMNGDGRRFRAAGYRQPKYLLPIAERVPMMDRVLASYAKLPIDQVIFIIRAQDYEDAKHVLHAGSIVPIDEPTRGPIDTILYHPAVRKPFRAGIELLIADCDSILDPTELRSIYDQWNISGTATAGVSIRSTTDAHCSFVQHDAQGWVTELREKDPFTTWSSTGPYWWKDSRDFLEAAIEIIAEERRVNGEYYVSTALQYHVEHRGRVKAVETTTFQHLGTPEAYETFLAHQSMGTIPPST